MSTNALRTSVRFPMKLALHVTTSHGTLEALTNNISANGILFTGPKLPGIDSQIEFTIQMLAAILGTQGDVYVHCVGRVVRHQEQEGESQAAAIIDEYYLRA